MAELNKIVLENENIKENSVVIENDLVKEANLQTEVSLETAEEENIKVTSKETKKTKSKSNFLAGLSTSLITVVAGAVVGMTNLVNVSLNASFIDDSVQYNDGVIQYSIDVKDLTEKESLRLYLYENGEFVELFNLLDEENDGIIDGSIEVDTEKIQSQLDGGENVRIEYRLDLKGDVGLNVERSFDSFVVRIDKFTSSIDTVDMWCNCSVDGCYYFKINYNDPLGKFSDFKAWIVDEKGNVATCTFSDDPHEEQKIYVGELVGSRCKLFIKYVENGVETYIQFSNGLENEEQKDDYKIINL